MKQYQLTEEEKNEIIESAKTFLLSKTKEIPQNTSLAFMKMEQISDNEFCIAYNAPNHLLYEMIKHSEISDLFFLHSKNYSLKANCIKECIDREDYQLARKLFAKLVRTSKYRDYVTDSFEDWEKCNLHTMQQVIDNYPLDEYAIPYVDSVSVNARANAFELAEKMLDYLTEKSKKQLYSHLMFADVHKKYVYTYINDLMFTVQNYAQKPRKKGFSDTNYATSTILMSFINLKRLKRIDVIESIMRILKNAGEDLKPLNYKRFLDSLQKHLDQETYMRICQELEDVC